MSKNLERLGYSVEVIFDRNWKVVVKYNNRDQYFYVFDSEEEAIEKYNNLK